jgi:hypothetical protein
MRDRGSEGTSQELSGWLRTPDGVSSLALAREATASLTAYEAPSWEPKQAADGRSAKSGDHLMATTIESGPTSGWAYVSLKPTSRIQP